jgi:hypothetical protein
MDQSILRDQLLCHELHFAELDYGCVLLLLSKFLRAECEETEKKKIALLETDPGDEKGTKSDDP